MREIFCDNPKIIIHPLSVEYLYHWRAYVFRGKIHHTNGLLFSTYTLTHNFFFNPKKHNITKDDLDNCYILNEKTGESFPLYIAVPCGHCDNCILSKQNSFVHRCHLETQSYPYKPFFVTLTYDEEHVPRIKYPHPIRERILGEFADCPIPHYNVKYVEREVMTLRKRDVQLFLKRLRINLNRFYPYQDSQPIRYTCTGEYGKNTRRPHYHLIIWNLRAHTTFEYDALVDLINKSWSLGYCQTRLMNPDHSDHEYSYTCKYLFKDKSRSKVPLEIENLLDCDIPDEFQLPYHCSSNRNGGIGTPFLRKHYNELRHKNAQFLNIWNQKVEYLQFNSFILNKLFPSYSQLVPARYRQAVRDLLWYDVNEKPISDTLYKDILEEFRESLTYIPDRHDIPSKRDKFTFNSFDECIEYINKHRSSRQYVAPSEARAMQIVREEFILHNFACLQTSVDDVKARSRDAKHKFDRQFSTELL